jgi:hypothetical protein
MSQAPPDLGPFRPPSTLEPEFHAPPPRPVPESLKKGAYEQKRRATVLGLVLFGLSALGLFFLTRGTTLDHYFLALPWFAIVGVASVASGAALALAYRLRPGHYVYLRDGIPMPARVRGLRLAVARTQHGSPVAYRYLCEVEYQPRSGGLKQAVLPSPEFSATFKDSTETPLRVGDYVTAVALPGAVEKTLTLYGFLRLNPDVDFVRRKGREGRPMGGLALALLSVGLAYLVLGLLAAVITLPSLVPVGFPEKVDPRWAIPVAAAIVVVTGAMAVLLMRRSEERTASKVAAANARARREGRPVEERVSQLGGAATQLVVGLFCGAVVLLLLASLVACVNALPDPGPPRYEGVTVDRLEQETWLFVLRSYAVRYRRDDGSQDKIAVPVERIAAFQQTGAEKAALERRPGYFGMPWLKDIHPVLVGDDGGTAVVLPDGSTTPLPR